jgi:deoxyribodipyrimidine photo-lyase
MAARASLVWFRHDLRIADNPALEAAVQRDRPVIPVYILAPEEEGAWSPGAASRWWLHQSLTSLTTDLQKRGSRLVIRRGDSLSTLQSLIQETGVQAVFWNRRYEPPIVKRDATIKSSLRASGLHVESFNTGLLFEPHALRNKAGKPFQVFTPFWKTCLSLAEPTAPLSAPSHLPAPDQWPDSLPLVNLQLEPTIDWAGGIRSTWCPGEDSAQRELQRFLATAVTGYLEHRDRPDEIQTSRLSPHLHFGEISPRQVWHAVRKDAGKHSAIQRGAEAYLRQLGWREFAHHLLFHFPHTVDQPLRPEFANFPWRDNSADLKAWQRGQTGYPLVDVGMRELWATGWMHNRVRMVAASFLVKHLLLPWQAGDRWFWDTLVDADLANNTLGWQWVAGCGADAAPYFRIFNPVAQGEKFDPNGNYVRRWVPELSRLPAEWIHKPWEAPTNVLTEAGVKLGVTYPEPIVAHYTARIRALAALATLKKGKRHEL